MTRRGELARANHRTYNLARDRAERALARRHKAEFLALFDAEKARLPDPELAGCTSEQAERRRVLLEALEDA